VVDVSYGHSFGVPRVVPVGGAGRGKDRRPAFHRWHVDGVFGLGRGCATCPPVESS